MSSPTSYHTKTEIHSIGGKDYQIRSLLDRQQFHDPDAHAENAGISSAAWPIFGQIWPAGLVLAEIMSTQKVSGLRILEIGCGLGIASMIATERGASILATDHHPLASTFMDHNSELNQIGVTEFAQCDWTTSGSVIGLFDLIIGSDLLYEAAHPAQLADFIDRHVNASSAVIMVDGGRKLGGRFDRNMLEHGFVGGADGVAYITGNFKGKVLRYTRELQDH